ncbi:hypothetical protein [Azospirillum thermophilum]|uniref:HTH DNA binding domain-containing protein n=1 Tax=Azospirillum thermophilum TaxID=2202148 RepID=A0A2S2CWL1_9PROT|nr:hypothetical protein [Azospirillum thermophilum]AWK88871.1 hypothetical protein DEW08_22695 [Azospirillum thermophilum]
MQTALSPALSPALLTALLEAERALGRLAELMQDAERRRRLWADAARREACAAARLDGIAVDTTDFLIATVSTDLVPTAGRGDAQSVRSLWQGCRFSQGALPAPERRPSPAALSRGGMSVASEVWQAVADLEAGLTDPEEGEDGRPSPSAAAMPESWTLDWMECCWRVLQAEVSGRDPDRLAFSAEREAEACTLLGRLDAAARPPALLGGVGLLAELLRPAPDLRLPSWAVPTARLLAAQAVARCCRLPALWLPLSVSLWTDRTAAAIAARGRDEEWLAWLADMVAETARRERQRVYSLDQAAESWRRRVGTRRRNSRLPEVLDRLFEEPAFTVRRIQRTLGTTFRGAQLIVDDLIEAGIAREVTNRALDRVFVAVDLMP